MRVVGFTLARDYFGIELQMVQEIIRNAPVFPFPNAPDFIEGVINLRTSIIPLINIRERLNIVQPRHKTGDQSRYIVLNIQDIFLCIKVDSVTGIHHIESTAPIAAAVSAPLDVENQYIKGTCTVGESEIKILACNRILNTQEQEQLEKISTDHTRII